MNSAAIKAIEAAAIGAAGAGIVAAGEALLAGQTDWRLILGAGLVAAGAKLLPRQMIRKGTH